MLIQDHPSVIEELDVVDESDQITHLLRLEEAGKSEDVLSKLRNNIYQLPIYQLPRFLSQQDINFIRNSFLSPDNWKL